MRTYRLATRSLRADLLPGLRPLQPPHAISGRCSRDFRRCVRPLAHAHTGAARYLDRPRGRPHRAGGRRGHRGAHRCEPGRRGRAPFRCSREGGPGRRAGLRGRGADVRAVRRDHEPDLGRDASGQPDGLVSLLSCGVHRHDPGRRRADRQHRLAVRRLRDREVPGAGRLQRVQVRDHRPHRGHRGGGPGARHQRRLRQSGRRRHRDAPPGQPCAASRPDPQRCRRADRGAA